MNKPILQRILEAIQAKVDSYVNIELRDASERAHPGAIVWLGGASKPEELSGNPGYFERVAAINITYRVSGADETRSDSVVFARLAATIEDVLMSDVTGLGSGQTIALDVVPGEMSELQAIDGEYFGTAQYLVTYRNTRGDSATAPGIAAVPD